LPKLRSCLLTLRDLSRLAIRHYAYAFSLRSRVCPLWGERLMIRVRTSTVGEEMVLGTHDALVDDALMPASLSTRRVLRSFHSPAFAKKPQNEYRTFARRHSPRKSGSRRGMVESRGSVTLHGASNGEVEARVLTKTGTGRKATGGILTRNGRRRARPARPYHGGGCLVAGI